jgi:hypothetical protein
MKLEGMIWAPPKAERKPAARRKIKPAASRKKKSKRLR